MNLLVDKHVGSNEYSVKEVIEIFIDIDQKLTSLNECSSEDFLTLNSYLKNYYKQAQIISQNANEIFKIILGEEQTDYYNKLNGLQIYFIEQINYFEEQVDIVVNSLEKIMSNLNLLFIPFKNFNQNAMTLYFLITNLKLNLNYIDSKVSQLIEADVKKINRTIQDLKSYFVLLEDDLSKLKNSIRFVISKLRELNEQNTLNVESIRHYISTSINTISQKRDEAKSKFPELNQKTTNYLESIDKIITNLQYQDIIRQKMEHVQATHKDIINELETIENSENQEIENQAKNKSFTKIRDIAGLQVAHLIHTNKEYQDAVEVITKKFLEVGDEIIGVSNLCFQFTGHIHSTDETHFKDIEKKLSNSVILINKLIRSNQEFVDDSNKIQYAIENIGPMFKSLVLIEVMLENTAFKTVKSSEHVLQDDEDLNNIVIQVKDLISYLENNSNQIQHYFQIAEEQLKNTQQQLNVYFAEKNVTLKLENINVEILNIVEQITDNNDKINRFLKENSRLGIKISSEIKSSIEQVKYYDFFEKVIDQIITSLNGIYTKFSFLNRNKDGKADKESIEQAQKRYTMKSERIIHEKVAANQLIDINDIKEDNDNIEFF